MTEAFSESPTRDAAQPPTAQKVPHARVHHGDEFIDHYEWLRNKDNPEVIEHLRAENFYTEALTKHQEQLRADIFNEIKSRTQETDLSVPGRRGGWWYYSRTMEGSQYPVYCRVAAVDTGDEAIDWTPPSFDPAAVDQPVPGEQILLDCNAEAEGKPFFSLGGFSVSEDGNLLAFSVDNAGDERFTQYAKDLRTGELLPDTIPEVFYGGAFSPDGRHIFYTVVDASWRPYQVRRHTLGTDVSEDTVIFTEADPGLWTGFDISANRRYLQIGVGCSEYSEVRLLDLSREDAEPVVLISREDRVLYEAEPVTLNGRDMALLVHNRDAINSMVSLVDLSDAGRPAAEQDWFTVVAHRDDVRVSGVDLTRSHLAVSLRKDTTERVQVIPLAALEEAVNDGGTPPSGVEPAFDESLYTCHVAGAEFEAPVIRLSYTSYLTPPRVYDYFPAMDYVPAADRLLLRRETPVLGGYDRSRYVAERDWTIAQDGTRIPLSIIRRVDLQRDGSNPVLQYAYGSYEVSMDPGFSIARLSLLDRGIIYVVAHVRGGGEMGRHWYDNGKKLTKKNTFTDFVDATDHIAASGWADPGRIAAMGGSAGGLLMGAVANLAPEKYAAIVAQVPFVDALTTILNPELPLSALEWEEWGNPITDPEVYGYMKSYSPYENVRRTAYPAIAAVTSLNDTRVLYVEPAKWVARLRELSTGSKPIVLKTEMDGGHGGPSGRYEKWKDVAWDYAFVIDALRAG